MDLQTDSFLDMDDMNISTIFPTTDREQDYSFSQSSNIVFGVCLIIIAITGFVGNVFVILAVMFSRQLQTAMNAFVVNLSIADLLASLTNTTWALSLFGWVTLSTTMCVTTTIVNITTLGCSLFTVTLIAINRYVRITKPRQTYNHAYTPVKIAIMITSAWLVAPIAMILSSATICGVYLVEHNSTFLSWIVPLLLVTSLIVVLVCYILIFRFIKRHVQKSTVAQASSKRLEMSITKNLLCVVCAFYICVFPYTITLILAKFFLTYAAYENILIAVFTVVLNANSIVNPFIYAAKHPIFRPIFYQMITGRWSQIQQPSRILKLLISTTMDKNFSISSSNKDCESALNS